MFNLLSDDATKTLRNYLSKFRANAGDGRKVSLVLVSAEPTIDSGKVAELTTFLQRSVRRCDLLLYRGDARWLVVLKISEDDLDSFCVRVRRPEVESISQGANASSSPLTVDVLGHWDPVDEAGKIMETLQHQAKHCGLVD